jgi:hypothetical protein
VVACRWVGTRWGGWQLLGGAVTWWAGGWQPGRPMGLRPGGAAGRRTGGAVAQWTCGTEAWQSGRPMGLPGGCPEGLWSGGLVAKRQLGGPTGWGLGRQQPGCSFSKLWHGEAFHERGVQSVEVSALPGALPPPSMSPASQEGP